jgi:ABC-2 type transport system ATP-binding protein
VLRGADLDVARGELLVLLGVNGAGKTSLMEVLTGHRRPTAGTVRLLGRDPHRDRRRLAADVGVMLQEGGLAPDLTVAETVRLWQRLHDRPPTTTLLTELRLDALAAVRVRQLSGGERRRLDLAVALAGEPSLLLLDEPTSGLDPESRAHTWAVLGARRRAGCTILFTTHYLEEAREHADRIAVLAEGRIDTGRAVAR